MLLVVLADVVCLQKVRNKLDLRQVIDVNVSFVVSCDQFAKVFVNENVLIAKDEGQELTETVLLVIGGL